MYLRVRTKDDSPGDSAQHWVAIGDVPAGAARVRAQEGVMHYRRRTRPSVTERTLFRDPV